MLQLIRANTPQPLAGGKPRFAAAGHSPRRLRSSIKLCGLAALIGAKDAQREKLLRVDGLCIQFGTVQQHHSRGTADPKMALLIFENGIDTVAGQPVGRSEVG